MQIQIDAPNAEPRTAALPVTRAFNFGFAGRDTAAAQAHVDELAELGFPAPTAIPSIYPIAADLVQITDQVRVRGDQTYGEVEFAVLWTADDVLVTVASDHSDMQVESVSTAHAKTLYPDVLGATAWRLSDVAPHWDELTMTCERLGEDGWQVTQEGSVSSLLAPDQLTDIIAERSGEAASAGTVLLSGTISGEIVPSGKAWRNTLTDPVLDRELVIEYAVTEVPLEL